MTHTQTWVKVNAPVDAGIADVIALLNRIPGLQTLDSCQGDPGGKPAHVFLRFGNWQQLGTLLFEEISPRLNQFSDDISVSCELFNGSDPMGKLTFSAEATPVVASALNDLLTNDRNSPSVDDNPNRELRS